MKTRCYNKNSPDYKNYGGRGIRICSEWLNNYLSFKSWAEENGYDEEAPKMQCTIDRIDEGVPGLDPGVVDGVGHTDQGGGPLVDLQLPAVPAAVDEADQQILRLRGGAEMDLLRLNA